jgi:hypothetical protein
MYFVLTPENAQTIQLIYDHSCQKAHLKDNPKRFWNYTRHFSKSSSSIAMIEEDGVKLTNDRDKAEVLNNFFISVLTQEQPLDHTPDLPVVNFDSALCDLDISPDQ